MSLSVIINYTIVYEMISTATRNLEYIRSDHFKYRPVNQPSEWASSRRQIDMLTERLNMIGWIYK